MKIISLQAENFKRLTAIEIQPDGNVVQITGKNGQGKTSVLDAIWSAVQHATHIHAEPIRKGAKSATIRLDLGEMTIERRFTEKGTYLTVEMADGSTTAKPQKMLDELIGELSFDPLAFARMRPKDQFDELRRVVKLDIDVEAIAAANKADFEKRTGFNRDAKAKRAQADGIKVPLGLPDEVVNETELLDQMEQASQHNSMIEKRRLKRQEVANAVAQATKNAQSARFAAAEFRAQAELEDQKAADFEQQAANEQQRLDSAQELPEPIDVANLRAQLAAAKTVSEGLELKRRRETIEAEAEGLEQQANGLTEAMESRTAAKQAAIAAADMPVRGLGLGEGVVLYNDVPFEQASSAEQLKVSLALAMASNPTLRVIRIQDGSLLDEDSMAQIAEMAADNDFQVWIESVDSTGKVGFVIEDGHLKAHAVAAE